MVDTFAVNLGKRIHARLVQDPRAYPPAVPLRVSDHGPQLVLEGQVGDIATKRIACNLARELAGDGYSVEDRLFIGSQELGDDALRDKAARILLDEPVFRDCDIRAGSSGRVQPLRRKQTDTGDKIALEVADGVIALTGQVNSLTHRRLAEALLWWINGCRRVDNRLTVAPPEQDTDDELSDAARIILEKDPLIDAMQIRIEVHSGTVVLNGHLSSEELSSIAAHDVWSIPDVREVDNRIHVGYTPY
ncbi:MAG: BON domain-containing protein [Gammaproteobacteria bacterium]